MSPEQAQGLPSLDHRADVWALAAIAYECLTGTVPFAGANGPAILLAILTTDPRPPSEAARAAGRTELDVPPTLDEVMEMALAKNPDLRHPTIGALADAFGHAYGLDGDHHAWARTPTAELHDRIAAALPAKLAALAPRQDLSGLDAAMSSAGGPAAAPGGGALASVPRSTLASSTADDMVVMGVKEPLPRWVVPLVAGVVVLCIVGIVVAFAAA
jgi:serine/threonine-protein kinase